jgi:predicted dehydrogenase
MMLLGYGNGISGVFSHSGYLGGSRNYFVIRGTEGLLYQDSAELYLEDKQGHRKDLEVEQTSAHERMWRHFVQCLEEDRAPDYNASRSLLEFRVFDAIAESLHGGRAAAVPGA